MKGRRDWKRQCSDARIELGTARPLKSTQYFRGSRHIVSSRASEYAEVNEALYKWFCLACLKNIFPGGTEKAREIATALGKSNFTGSRGWLEKWKKR